VGIKKLASFAYITAICWYNISRLSETSPVKGKGRWVPKSPKWVTYSAAHKLMTLTEVPDAAISHM